MDTDKMTEIPVLPLKDLERVEGLTKLILERKTYIGEMLHHFWRYNTNFASADHFAKVLASGPTLVRLVDGHLDVNGWSGLPVSVDQVIQCEAMREAFPNADLSIQIKPKTFSFAATHYGALLDLLRVAKAMDVYLTITHVVNSGARSGSHTEFDQYEIEFITTSKMSEVYEVMTNAELGSPYGDADETLRECAAPKNSFEKDSSARKRNIEAEKAFLRKAVSDALFKNLNDAMSSVEVSGDSYAGDSL